MTHPRPDVASDRRTGGTEDGSVILGITDVVGGAGVARGSVKSSSNRLRGAGVASWQGSQGCSCAERCNPLVLSIF